MNKDLWVFGYGSLMWEPGFGWAERRMARLEGFHRSFCMWSIHHRGTPERPGLVLALDAQAGAACDGVAYRVPAPEAAAVTDYLRDRELVSSAYLETRQTVALAGGAQVAALTFIVDTTHSQYCAGLALERQAQVIAAATGGRGPNPDYLWNTVAHLAELGIRDADLEWLDARVRALQAG